MIEMRGGDLRFLVVATEVAVAEVIGIEKDDIG